MAHGTMYQTFDCHFVRILTHSCMHEPTFIFSDCISSEVMPQVLAVWEMLSIHEKVTCPTSASLVLFEDQTGFFALL